MADGIIEDPKLGALILQVEELVKKIVELEKKVSAIDKVAEKIGASEMLPIIKDLILFQRKRVDFIHTKERGKKSDYNPKLQTELTILIYLIKSYLAVSKGELMESPDVSGASKLARKQAEQHLRKVLDGTDLVK